MKAKIKAKCWRCDGDGCSTRDVEGSLLGECPNCQGTGRVEFEADIEIEGGFTGTIKTPFTIKELSDG